MSLDGRGIVITTPHLAALAIHRRLIAIPQMNFENMCCKAEKTERVIEMENRSTKSIVQLCEWRAMIRNPGQEA